ncbi:hypothetical protein FHS70_002310 [Flammeovirga yaeyamensis]|nr:hypothetical protein [Flammeovirga yaeyamensis]
MDLEIRDILTGFLILSIIYIFTGLRAQLLWKILRDKGIVYTSEEDFLRTLLLPYSSSTEILSTLFWCFNIYIPLPLYFNISKYKWYYILFNIIQVMLLGLYIFFIGIFLF